MSIKASGGNPPTNSLKFSEIVTEFGIPPNKNLGAYRVSQTVGGLSNQPLDTNIPQSGEIKFSDFYGKRLNVIIDYHSGSTENRPSDARAKYQAGSASGNRTIIGGFKDRILGNSSGSKVRIHVNKTIGSAEGNVNNCAVKTGSFETGTSLIVDIGNSGKLYGAGGSGGAGGDGSEDGEQGSGGTSALGIQFTGTIVNLLGGDSLIQCGFGGGGGGGGGYNDPDKNSQDHASGGGGGGGGAGLPAGSGGRGGTGDFGKGDPGSAGSDGTISHGGSGGSGGSGGGSVGGDGGNGGDSDADADSGEDGGGNVGEGDGGVGGGNGAAIRKTSGMSWSYGTNSGTVTGDTTANDVA